MTALRVGTLADGWTRGSRSLELETDGRCSSCAWNLGGVVASGDIRLSVFGPEKTVGDELNRCVSHSSYNTGALQQVADGKSGRAG